MKHSPPGRATPSLGVLLPPFQGGYTVAPSLREVEAGHERLHIGHQGESVKELQGLLGLSGSRQDGVFGPATRQAVFAFQLQHGMRPLAGQEGDVDRATLERLRGGAVADGVDAADRLTWKQAPSADEVLRQGRMLQQGMRGPAVEEVQAMLGMEVHGRFDPETQAAVRWFQRAAGLELPVGLEGSVGRTTLEALRCATGERVTRDISVRGREQMRRLVEYMEQHPGDGSRGQGFEAVWRYLTESGYGKLGDYSDASDMQSAQARNFAEYMNREGHAARWGLRRLVLASPYDAPPGAVVVVASGSPGVSHPTSGDLSVAAGNGCFLSERPHPGYGHPSRFLRDGGRVLGIYVPL